MKSKLLIALLLFSGFSFADDNLEPLIKDAKRVETFKSFPGPTDKLCNGKTALYQPKFSITLVVPKADSSVALDKATEMHTQFVERARGYLQNNFFFDMGDFKPGFNENEDISEARSLSIPMIDKEVDTFLKNVEVPGNYYDKDAPQKSFMIIVNPKTNAMAMATKVVTLFRNFSSGPTVETLFIGSMGASYVPSLSKRVFFEFSHQAVNTAGSTYIPLVLAKAVDLSSLVTENSFMRENGQKILPSRSLTFQKPLWRQYFIDHTLLEEAPQADGTIKFLIRLDMNGFCKDGIALSSLKAS